MDTGQHIAWSRIVGYAVGAIALVLGGWAGGTWYFSAQKKAADGLLYIVHPVDLAQTVSVSGTVTAAHDVDLGFEQGGRVAHIAVAVGDTVKAGDELVSMDNADLRAGLLQKQAALDAEKARLASLRSGTRPEQIAVDQSQVDSAQAALSQSSVALTNAIRDGYTTSDSAVHRTVDEFFNNPRGSSPTITFTVSDAQAQTTLQNSRGAVEGAFAEWQTSVSALSTSSDLDAAVVQAQQNLSAISSLLYQASTALSKAVPATQASQTTIAGYTTDIAAARTAVNSAITALTSAQTAQKNAAAALAIAQKNLTLAQSGATQDDIAAEQAQVEVAAAAVETARAQYQKTTILAPMNGIITRVDAKRGEIVAPTSNTVSMINTGALQIEAFVPEISISLVHATETADVTLDAYGPDAHFSAQVISVDLSATLRDNVPTYRTLLQFNAIDPRIRTGMTANFVITAGGRTGVFAVPQNAIVRQGSEVQVQVRAADGSFQKRAVTTGITSSQGLTEIMSGLSDGDAILLTPTS